MATRASSPTPRRPSRPPSIGGYRSSSTSCPGWRLACARCHDTFCCIDPHHCDLPFRLDSLPSRPFPRLSLCGLHPFSCRLTLWKTLCPWGAHSTRVGATGVARGVRIRRPLARAAARGAWSSWKRVTKGGAGKASVRPPHWSRSFRPSSHLRADLRRGEKSVEETGPRTRAGTRAFSPETRSGRPGRGRLLRGNACSIARGSRASPECAEAVVLDDAECREVGRGGRREQREVGADLDGDSGRGR